MRLEDKMVDEIHYKWNNSVWREQRIQDRKGWKEVPKREINVRQNLSLGHTVPYTNNSHKDTGRSNMFITNVTIMVAKYEKRHHIKSKGFMATSEQGGSILNNRS